MVDGMVAAIPRHFEEALMREDISPGELRARLDQKQNLVLLDVRDEWETKLCRLEHSTHIPMEEIEFKLDLVSMRKEGAEGRLNFLKAIS